MEVQIFGIRKSPETRKALRFFAERRVKTHFGDLMERPHFRVNFAVSFRNSELLQ